jgi:MraZ protein
MLIGEYFVQIGDKNRIAIPKKIRESFNGKVILTRGYERCLILVDSQRWDNLISQINVRPLLSLSVRDTKRFIIGGAVEVEYDQQGRFVLPEPLKRFASLEEKLVILGVGEWVEIWSEERWLTKLEDLSQNVSDIADRLVT